jgi:hypothetical protein
MTLRPISLWILLLLYMVCLGILLTLVLTDPVELGPRRTRPPATPVAPTLRMVPSHP